jgi:glycosyltransferase involved in cell wall biosynthesis
MYHSCVGNVAADVCLPQSRGYYPVVKNEPLPQCEVCVIVPVRNEAQLLETCLNALAHQIDLTGRPIDSRSYEVILLANNCNDNSAEIAHHFSRQHPSFQLHVVECTLAPCDAYIGRVRQILMDEAYDRLSRLGLAKLGSKSGVIASTDGDTRVASTWIAATQSEIARGADAVGGRIIADVDSCNALAPLVKKRYIQGDYYHQLIVELETYLDATPHDQWPRHAQHYGASLAVTAQMYRKAGGMPATRSPEDVAFYHALLRVGARFRHSPLVKVSTSARQTVRTEQGFAAQLNIWEALGQQQAFLVESATAIEIRFKVRRYLRDLWRQVLNGYQHHIKDVSACANILGVGSHWLWSELAQPQPFDLMFEQVEARQQQTKIWQQRWPLVHLEEAIADLSNRLQILRPQHPIGNAQSLPQLSVEYAYPGDFSQ